MSIIELITLFVLVAASIFLGLSVGRSRSERKIDCHLFEEARLKPGDIIVLHYKADLTEKARKKLAEAVEKYFSGHKALVLGDDMRLGILHTEEHEDGGDKTNEKTQ